MIKTRNDLKEYITADRNRNHGEEKFGCIRAILGIETDGYRVRNYLNVLRHLEFYNNISNKNIFTKICYAYYKFLHLKLSNKYKIFIAKNMVGKGLFIAHTAPFIGVNCLKMGDYCTLNRGAQIGNKSSQKNRPIIGDNVEITTGAKVFGKVTIGDNAIVCPNSVVIKDVPANAIVSGVPAQIVKIIDSKN